MGDVMCEVDGVRVGESANSKSRAAFSWHAPFHTHLYQDAHGTKMLTDLGETSFRAQI